MNLIKRDIFLFITLPVILLLLLCSLGFCDFDQAMGLYKNKKFKEARESFLEFVAKNQNSSNEKPAQFYAIKCLFEMKQYREFNWEVESLRKKAPDHPSLDDLAFLQAYAEQLQQNWNKALELFREFKKKYTDSSYMGRVEEHIKRCLEWFEPDFDPGKNKTQNDYFSWLIKIYHGTYYEKFLERSGFFMSQCPRYANNDELMFYQMHALRKLTRWDEARSKANELIALFPDSRYTRMMGGINGKSEDDAAFDFADLVKSYHDKNFTNCISRIENYLLSYPNNWRIPEVYRFYSFALYHNGESEKFYKISGKFIEENLNPEQSDHVAFLQAVMMVKQERYQESNDLLETLKTKYPDSNLYHKFLDLSLESLYKQKNYGALEQKAGEVAKQYKANSKEWGVGMIWRGIAKSNGENPDYHSASRIFENLLNGELTSSSLDTHTLSTAAIWGIWIAEKKGDVKKAKEILHKVRDQMPEGKEKNKVLERFGSLLNK